MKFLNDCFGRIIRLTDERLLHILAHPEMLGMEDAVSQVLLRPELIRSSQTDPDIQLFYQFFAQTRVGGKWLCVVVKYTREDAFVVTAYLTGKPKAGGAAWLEM
jgi:hypothetical protein